MRVHQIAAVEGQGVGPVLVAAGLEVLAACAARDGRFRFEVEIFGDPLAEADLDRFEGFAAILSGAASASGGGDGAAIARHLGLSVTICPIRMLRGLTSPLRAVDGLELNWLIIGENRSGEPGAPALRDPVTPVMRHAFQLARQRPRKLLTVVTNPMTPDRDRAIWGESAAEIAQGYRDVVWNETPVEVAAMRMTLDPRSLDTLVASRHDVGVLSALAAALAGSPAIAASETLTPGQATPALFQPLHARALQIANDESTNPIGAFWAGAMLLNHLGENEAAARLMGAIESATSHAAFHPPDLGGRATTAEATRAVCEAINGDRI